VSRKIVRSEPFHFPGQSATPQPAVSINQTAIRISRANFALLTAPRAASSSLLSHPALGAVPESLNPGTILAVCAPSSDRGQYSSGPLLAGLV